MPVEFWTGGEFEYTHERKAQDEVTREFRTKFQGADYPVLVVFNVFCNGKPLDLLVLKQDAVIIVDFKECGNPLKATENGNWAILSGGELPGNPFRQVAGYRYSVMDFLAQHSADFLRPQKAAQADFNRITAVVAISPSLHRDSINAIGRAFPYFHLVGLDQLSQLVEQVTNKNFAFSQQELTKLVEHVLKCRPLRTTETPKAAVPQADSPQLKETKAPTALSTARLSSSGKVEHPGTDGMKRGVRLFRYLAEQANAGRAVGVSYGRFIGFLNGKGSFQEAVGRNYLPGDSGKVIEFANGITALAGGRIPIRQRSESIDSGMDSFIWNKSAPFDRPDRAFHNPKGRLPYTREQWSAIFPAHVRRMITDRELNSLT